MRKQVVSVVILLSVLFWSDLAYAYLDAGSGSMILQLLLGGFAGLVVILKLYWHRLRTLFGIDKDKKGDPQ